MPHLKNISFSAECQDFIINNPINIPLLHEIHLEARSKKDARAFSCVHCGSKNIHLNRTYLSTIKGIPLHPGYTTKIKTSIRSFECQCCKKVFSEQVPFLYPGTRISNLMAQWIKELLLVTSISSISKLLNVHWGTIKGLHKQLISKTLTERRKMLLENGYRPKFLGVDEFALKRQHKYATVVLDLETGEVLWVGKGRSIADFSKFFDEIENPLLSEVRAVAMDMNAAFNKVFKEKLPQAAIVYDRYHMESNFGRDVMGAVRLEAAREYKTRANEEGIDKQEKKKLTHEYSKLKGARWILLSKGLGTREDNGNWMSDNFDLQNILNEHRNIATCYAMKEEMDCIYKMHDEKEAKIAWEKWFSGALASQIPALVKFANNKHKRLEGLIAHAKYPITTGKVEGTNNKIKVLKRIAYGYRDEEYFFNLIRYSTIPDIHKYP